MEQSTLTIVSSFFVYNKAFDMKQSISYITFTRYLLSILLHDQVNLTNRQIAIKTLFKSTTSNRI